MEILENVLSIDKIKHLQELGVNTGNASMTWMLYPYEEGKQPQLSLREWRTFKEPFTKGTLLVDVDVVFVNVVATETRYASDPAAGT